jgi:HAD superfamily hydrolase (TIGR01509 family)
VPGLDVATTARVITRVSSAEADDTPATSRRWESRAQRRADDGTDLSGHEERATMPGVLRGEATHRVPLRAVVFDVDGTLVDSERHGHRIAFNEAFAAVGRPDHWSEAEYGELLRIAGGRQRLVSYLVGTGVSAAEAEPLAEQVHRIKTSRFRDRVASGEIPLMPGVTRLVAGLRRRDIRLFVATTGSRDWVEPLLDQHFGRSVFEVVVTGSDVMALKPDPAAYLEVLRQGRLDPAEVVAVEDSANGLRAAHAAGLSCLVVRNDYTGPDVDDADLAVSGLGPHAAVLSGGPAPMPHGLVTVETLEALAGRRAGPVAPKRRPRRLRGRHRSDT